MTAVTVEKTTVLVESDRSTKVATTEVLGTVVENRLTETVVTDSGKQAYSTQVETYYAVGGGVQGPPGIPGASTQFEYHPAGQTLGGGRAVTLDPSGNLVYPDTTSANSFVLGLTTGSVVLGALGEVQITGTYQEPSWAWTVGLPVFVSIDGVLTQTPPTSGQTLIVGWAATPTKIVIDKQTPIFME